jgi:hypothetical protein
MRISRFLFAGLAAVAACGGSGSVAPMCTGAISIQVSGGTKPSFSWTPVCAATGIIVVEPAASGPPAWSLFGPSTGIRPPVVYGSSPSGAQSLVTQNALQLNHTYTVYVSHGFRSEASGSDSLTFSVSVSALSQIQNGHRKATPATMAYVE